MNETLHGPGILGKASYIGSVQNKFKFFSDAIIMY